MLKDIIRTIGSRYFVAFLGLMLIFINARVLGLEGVGTIGLIWASVSILLAINSVLSSNTIVYFTNKYAVRYIYPISFLWIFIGSSVGCGVLSLIGLFPEGYGWDIYFVTILYSIAVAHSRFLLAKDKIGSFNLVNMLQGGLLFFSLICLYFVFDRKEVYSYVLGLYITNGVAVLFSLYALLLALKEEKTSPSPSKNDGQSCSSILKEMFVYGLWGSADNIAETCTTRLNYFLVERFTGLASVGLLDAGTKVSESVWNISKSVAYIEYKQVAKESDEIVQKRITLRLFKLTFLVITLTMGCILLIPEWVYTDYLFNPDFAGIRNVIAALSIGIITLGGNTILTHYFIGSGRIKHSTFSSCIGLATLLITGSLFIPLYGVFGSAISTSIAFTAMLVYSLIVFSRTTRTSFKEFLPCKDDFRLASYFIH